MDLGREEEAAAAYRRVESREPVAAAVGLARIALRRGDPEAAAAVLEPFAGSGASSDVLRFLSQAYARQGRRDEANTMHARAGEAPAVGWSDPRSAAKKGYEASLGAKLASARALLQSGRAGEALSLVEPLRERYPDRQGVLLVLIEGYRQTGRRADARDVLAAAEAAPPRLFPRSFARGRDGHRGG